MTRLTPNSTRIAAVIFLALAASAALAQTDAQKAFATLKSMPGTWEGKASDGQTVEVTFKVVSGGSAVMSEIVPARL
jgi:hypothetical protein